MSETKVEEPSLEWAATAGYLLLAALSGLASFLLSAFLDRYVFYLLYIVVLVAVSYKDLRERRIPNLIIYPAIVVALGAMFRFPGWQTALAGGLAAGVLFIVPVFIFGPARAGLGDVKLAFFIGLILGFSYALYWALFIAFAAGTLVGVVGILRGALSRKSLLPFGPFLALGAAVILVIRPFAT
jgi:prepilin signal peptidase PulO-like enzyme (type II secretory pathway)